MLKLKREQGEGFLVKIGEDEFIRIFRSFKDPDSVVIECDKVFDIIRVETLYRFRVKSDFIEKQDFIKHKFNFRYRFVSEAVITENDDLKIECESSAGERFFAIYEKFDDTSYIKLSNLIRFEEKL